METQVKKYGIEIEGEWLYSFATDFANKHNLKIKGDGSIRKCRNGNHVFSLDPCELTKDAILDNRTGINYVKKLFQNLQEAYNNGFFHYNKTCGLHFHFSFTPGKPPEIISTQFIKVIHDKIQTDFPKVYRKRHNNSYCAYQVPENELIAEGTRYRFVNTLPAYYKHGTIEIRAFGADEPKKMFDYFNTTLKTIKHFLKQANHSQIMTTKTEIEIDYQKYTEIETYNENILKCASRFAEVVPSNTNIQY